MQIGIINSIAIGIQAMAQFAKAVTLGFIRSMPDSVETTPPVIFTEQCSIAAYLAQMIRELRWRLEVTGVDERVRGRHLCERLFCSRTVNNRNSAESK